MTKKEKLEMLDGLVADKLIEFIEDGRTDSIPDLSAAIQYLKANQVVQEKEKRTKDDDHKEALKRAKERREKRERLASENS